MKEIRLIHFISGLLFVSLGFISKAVYRPYAYSNDLFDLGSANSLPSLFYVAGFSLLLSINGQFKVVYIMIIVTTCSILYELYQHFEGRIFDKSDVIYSVIGGVLALVIHHGINTRRNKNTLGRHG